MVSKLIDQYYNFGCLMVLCLMLMFFAERTFAEDHTANDDNYDGSEFKRPSFEDTSFAKTDYRELRSTVSSATLRENDGRKESDKLAAKRSENGAVLVTDDKADKGHKKNASKRITDEERRGPVMELPGDWVPDKLDPTSNGGFGVAPDNGSPVPYRLNGHVDIQRGRP